MWYGSVTAEGVPAGGVVDLVGGWEGDTLFTLAGNGSVSRWDVPSRTMTPLFRVDPRHFSRVCPPRLAVSPGGGHLLATDNEKIAVWDLAAGQPCTPIDCHDGSITYPCFVEAGRALYTVGVSAHRLIRWSWPGLEQLALPDHLRDLTEFAFAAAANWTGTRLAVSTDGGVVLWDVAKGRLLMTIQDDAGDWDDEPMACSPDGETFVVGHGSTLRLCEVRRGKVAQTIAVETGPVSRIAFHPEGFLFATAGESPLVTFWDAESGRRRRTWELPFQAVRSLAFSLDGYTCAAGSDGREFAVWDVDDG
jgi:dynein assembly factor with WDR repeat domains 1